MSNLKERIGRKVGHNKSWVRPGYQVKHSSSKQSQTRKQIPTTAGYESDQSSHEADSGHRDTHPSHPDFRNSARKTSLLERMGLSPGIDSGGDDEDTEAVAKSLIERAQTPDNVDPFEKEQESVKVPPLDVLPLASDSNNGGTATANIPANGNTDRDDLSPQTHGVFQDHPQDGERSKSKSDSATNSAPPRSSCNPTESENGNCTDSYSNDVDMHNTHSPRTATPLQSSSTEDGEVRDLETPEKVRELLAPLMLQNAASRTSTAHDARSQPMPLDMDTLTNNVCSSFQGRVKDLRKSMDLSTTENGTNPVAVAVLDGLAKPGAANDSPQQAGSTQKDPAPQPKASTSQFATRREESSLSNEPLTYGKDYTTLRYTPSPQGHHWSRSSVGSLQTDSLRDGRRSSSPLHYTSRRRSPSGERRYRLLPNTHEYHSPEPQFLREDRSPSHRYRLPPNAHEYHSPEPQFSRQGRRSSSPSRHTGRRRSPPGEYTRRLPLNAHEYHSPEPPSTRSRSPRRSRSPASASRSRFFPDKFRRSPDSRSRSPYESTRHRRGTLHRRGRSRGDYRRHGRQDDYSIRKSASPRPRRPYKPYSTNRRGSRSPRHHSQSCDSQQMSDQVPAGRYSPERQPKKVPDDSFSSQPMSISDPSKNNRLGKDNLSENIKSLEPIPPFYSEQNAPGEIATVECNLDTLPCHHVPGLWFVKVALNDMGTLECSFDIDSETAIKWNFSRIGNDAKPDITDHTLSLQICCFATELVEETFHSFQHNATPEDIASAIFSLKMEWPTQGHLIIVVNPQDKENYAKQVFLPEKLGPTSSPICINDFVHQGQNIVQFIQLSDMADKVFVLCATKNQNIKPDVTYASKEDITIGTQSSVVEVLPLE